MGKKFSQEYVEKYFLENNCKLISSYVNIKELMDYICECGNESKISFDNFKHGKRCKQCGLNKLANKFKHDYEYVRSFFKMEGCILLSSDYINSHTPLNYICVCGNERHITFSDFQNGKRCWDCGRKKLADIHRNDYTFVKNYFSEYGCELLSTSYKNAHQPLTYICVCGESAVITFDKFVLGQRCYSCGIKKYSGINHYNYNANLTDEEREISRNYPEYREWSCQVKIRDNYTCQKCNQVGYDLVSHHIENYRDNKKLRLDIDNGITLCKQCHIEFHTIYGYRNTNRSQLEEFLNIVKI